MVVIDVVKKPDFDKMARKVFMKAIDLVGGLKKLAEFRNLTWLPSLAKASYAVVLKNEGLYTNLKIASELGIAEQTVKNILEAKEEEVEKWLSKEIEELDEHRAGGLAKLAYKKLKEEGTLESEEVTEKEISHVKEVFEIDIGWAVYVLARIRGLDFPVKKEELKERLEGLKIKSKPIEEILEKIEYPIATPAELLKKIKSVLES